MPNKIETNGIVLTQGAIDIIQCLQEENSEGFREQKETLSLLLVEIVQQNVGDDMWIRFAKSIADQLDLINCLQA